MFELSYVEVMTGVTACFFEFFSQFLSPTDHYPAPAHVDSKDMGEAVAVAAREAARAAGATGGRTAKPVAGGAKLEVEEIKKLLQGAAWKWGERWDEAYR